MSGTGIPVYFLRSSLATEWEASIQLRGTHGTNGCLHLVRMTLLFGYGNHCPNTPLEDCRPPVMSEEMERAKAKAKSGHRIVRVAWYHGTC